MQAKLDEIRDVKIYGVFECIDNVLNVFGFVPYNVFYFVLMCVLGQYIFIQFNVGRLRYLH